MANQQPWSTKSSGTYKKDRGRFKGHNKKPGFKRGEIDPDAPKTPADRKRPNSKICGARRTGKSSAGPGICCQLAGWGTDHVGYGHCKYHGGGLPAHGEQARQERESEEAIKAMDTFGLPKDLDPHAALADLVQRTAGHVAWLGELVANLDDPAQLKQMTDTGIRPSVWIEMYQEERRILKQVAETAIKCGVAERQVRLNEEIGRLLAGALSAFIHSPLIALTPQQLSKAPKVMREVLLKVPNEYDARALVEAGPADEPEVVQAEVVESEFEPL